MPGKHLNSQAQELVLNLCDYFEKEKGNGVPLIFVDAVYDRVPDVLHISRRTICTIRKPKAQNPNLSSPGKKRPRAKPKTTDLPDSSKMKVKNIIYNMYKERKHVTLSSLKAELALKEVVQLGKSSLAILLREIGFKFKIECNRRALVEKFDIVCMRSTFLRLYMNNLSSEHSREVIFLDETWIYAKGTRGKSWQDASTASVRKPEGYDGKRFIVIHAGSYQGLVENASLVFASKSNVADYHGEMNSELFTKWMENLLLQLRQPTLIVMDNAPYHSVVATKVPNTSTKKQDIIEWLQKNNINCSNELTKYELLNLVKIHKPEKIYVIDELIRKAGHEVLRLPPHQCEFNAIELIWAKAKAYYNANIGRDGYGDDKIIDMWNEALATCTSNVWENCVRHTNKIRNEWYGREKYLADIEVEPVVIHIGNESDSSSEFDSENE